MEDARPTTGWGRSWWVVGCLVAWCGQVAVGMGESVLVSQGFPIGWFSRRKETNNDSAANNVECQAGPYGGDSGDASGVYPAGRLAEESRPHLNHWHCECTK